VREKVVFFARWPDGADEFSTLTIFERHPGVLESEIDGTGLSINW
jgi:hypothetical protein